MNCQVLVRQIEKRSQKKNKQQIFLRETERDREKIDTQTEREREAYSTSGMARGRLWKRRNVGCLTPPGVSMTILTLFPT